ncbi:unnamed protein product [Lymnaea stagnalis]|uniref:FAS1 domain-containing protein n=1 Tax=Lymnaea stagnalis TaxID=6523 RepID=A0AAV2HC83_LYMST
MQSMTPARLITSASHALLVCLLLGGGVVGDRRKRQAQPLSNGAPGPNMCKIQHVVGSNDKYFTHCVAKHLKLICERPTYERWECCSGFTRKGRDPGCPVEKPLGNVMETAKDLKLTRFVQLAEKSDLSFDLSNYGPYTAFIPTDEAIAAASPRTASALSSSNTDHPLLSYHVAPGRLNISTFRDRDQELVTLHGGDKIRVNKYAYGVATVNCARIIRPDELATNGVVHVIDKVITPLDVYGTLAERVAADDHFSQFNLAMLVSDMANKLKAKKTSFTVLAPTDKAFAKLPRDVLTRILSDADTAEKVLERHIIRGVYCADAIVVSVGLKTLDNARLLFRCKRDGLLVNDARVVFPDMVASNGVLHGIDTVLLPDYVKSASDILNEMSMETFLELASMAGLNDTLDDSNVTIFSPTDTAFKALPRGFLAAMKNNASELEKLIKYHTVSGRVTDENVIGDTTLPTRAGLALKVKVKITRKGMTVDKAIVDSETRECKDAVIHKIHKVLVPTEKSLLQLLEDDPDMSEFLKMLHQSGIAEMLLPDGSYTLTAPNNRAFSKLNEKQLQKIIENPIRLKKFVQRHVLPQVILKCTIPDPGIYTMISMQLDATDFAFGGPPKKLYVNKHAVVVSDDILASNGVLYKIDHVLPCSCEPTLRTDRGHYINDHRYRRLRY